jgi:SAM-dependent methyltransferase
MAHFDQQNFVSETKKQYPEYFINKKVLEIGSWIVNGTVRDFFENCDYLGIDLSEGPGVDLISFGHEYSAPDNSYDTVISCECFEHDMFYEKTFSNMFRMCKNDGIIIFTCATTGRGEHGTRRTTPQDSLTSRIPSLTDYYKNLVKEDFLKIFNFNEHFKKYEFSVKGHDLYFYGIKN